MNENVKVTIRMVRSSMWMCQDALAEAIKDDDHGLDQLDLNSVMAVGENCFDNFQMMAHILGEDDSPFRHFLPPVEKVCKHGGDD